MILSRWSAVVGVILPLLRKWVFGLKIEIYPNRIKAAQRGSVWLREAL